MYAREIAGQAGGVLSYPLRTNLAQTFLIYSPPHYGRESHPLLTQGAGQPGAQESSSNSLNTVAPKE